MPLPDHGISSSRSSALPLRVRLFDAAIRRRGGPDVSGFPKWLLSEGGSRVTAGQGERQRAPVPRRGAAVAQHFRASSLRHQGPPPRREIAPEEKPAFTQPGHRARLVSNFNYDLLQEFKHMLTASWHMQQYINDADGHCDRCVGLWRETLEQERELAERLRAELSRHMKEGRFL